MITEAAMNDQPEERTERTPAQVSSYWQLQLALAERQHKPFHEDGQAVIERYKNEKGAAQRRDGRTFNILYSNVETLKPALYGRAAKPDVRRRFGEKDPVARQAAEVIERGLIYCAETYDVDRPLERAIHDMLLPGRGVVRVSYDPIIEQRPAIDPMTMQPGIGHNGGPALEDYIAERRLRLTYIYWKDYLQGSARIWEDVPWVAFRHSMSRDDMRANGFLDADTAPLNWQPNLGSTKEAPDDLKKAEVWEIWDKARRERVWIIKGHPNALRVDPDPYGLEGFFPLPEPPTARPDTESSVPQPEFHIYRDQADDLDEITARISRLTKALKRRGVYDQTVKELKRLAKAGDNEFIPVTNYEALSQKGGLQAAFQVEDISQIATVLGELYKQRDMLVQAIYEVSGIADIMRGSSDPNETLGAQQLKAQFGSQRLKKRQRMIQKWIRDLYKLKAEIIAEHFDQETLAAMTGVELQTGQEKAQAQRQAMEAEMNGMPLPAEVQHAAKAPSWDEVMQLLQGDKLRSYRIDIETDSTVFEDAEGEKKAVTETLTAVGGFLQQALPTIQQAPELGPLCFEMLSMALRVMKPGRQLEDVIEQARTAIEAKLAAPPPMPMGPPGAPAPGPEGEMIEQPGAMPMQAAPQMMQ